MYVVIRFRRNAVRESCELRADPARSRAARGVRWVAISDLETGRAKALRLTLPAPLCDVLGAASVELIEYDAPEWRGRA